MKDDFGTHSGEHKSLMLADEIIAEAKAKSPCSVCFKGRLSFEEREVIAKECRITVPSVYMDGTVTYYIRWDGWKDEGEQQ